MDSMTRISPVMRIPPPLLFVVSFLAGAGVQHSVGVALPVLPAARIAGMGLTGCGVLLALCSLAVFFRARTTVVPFSDASRLVTWGTFPFTRNPMYVALILAYLGFGAIFSQVVALLFLPVLVLMLRQIVIPFEEARMRHIFGPAYDHYCLKVRRWL
jgi:protein-S-isoprenylcysteine O-methyltransferase Ste14